jgi:hypothetical protein
MNKKRYTRRNLVGVKGKSTLLKGLAKMRRLHQEARTNVRLRKQNDFERSLNSMAKWLESVKKCPPRHYGKVWNDEKDHIVAQCERMYEDMQSSTASDVFMGVARNWRDDKSGDGRFISMDRLRWSMAKSSWDYSNRMQSSKDPYWNPPSEPAKCTSYGKDYELYADYLINVAEKHRFDGGEKVVKSVGMRDCGGGRFGQRIIEWT